VLGLWDGDGVVEGTTGELGHFPGENLVPAWAGTDDGDAFGAAYFNGGIVRGSCIVVLV
jgi:hypothetical protein